MPEPKSEVLRGTLDILILKVVALGPNHGYAIAQRLGQISKEFFRVHQGSLYPALHRLEDRGLLSAKWLDTDTGREAKFYALTSKGRKQLETEILDWEQLSKAVALVLATRQAGRGCGAPSSDAYKREGRSGLRRDAPREGLLTAGPCSPPVGRPMRM